MPNTAALAGHDIQRHAKQWCRSFQ